MVCNSFKGLQTMIEDVPMHGIFFKIGQLEHLQDLQSGNLFFNPIDYFKQGSSTRFDHRENISNYIYRPKGFASINGTKVVIDKMIESVSIDSVKNDVSHIWCCSHLISGIAKKDSDSIINSQMRGFGSHLLLFKNTQEFLDRYKKSFDQKNIISDAGIIEYKDISQSHNDLTIHNKLSSYEWQNEYRIAAKFDTVDVMKVNIGNLEDISVIASLDHIQIKIEDTRLIIEIN